MTKPQKIILLEDDPTQAEWLANEVIWKSNPEAELRYYDSEYSLLEAIRSKQLQEWEPQYAVIDLLIRYYSPQDLAEMLVAPKLDSLPDVTEAGVRCREAILQAFPTTRVAIITVLERTPPGCYVIQKGSDELSEMLVKFLS